MAEIVKAGQIDPNNL